MTLFIVLLLLRQQGGLTVVNAVGVVVLWIICVWWQWVMAKATVRAITANGKE